MTQLECACAQSMLASRLQRWSRRDFIAAIYQLWYMYGKRNQGLIYTRDQDPHGANVVWMAGDADLGSHASRKIRTGSVVAVNGCAVLVKSKLRGVHDATARAELEASFFTGLHGLGFVNVMNELEYWQCANVCYTDNAANFKFIDGRMSLQSKNKHAEIRHLLIKQWCEQNRLRMEWMSTHDMVADIATKNLPVEQFQVLRDHLAGYSYATEVLKRRASEYNNAPKVQKMVQCSPTQYERKMYRYWSRQVELAEKFPGWAIKFPDPEL